MHKKIGVDFGKGEIKSPFYKNWHLFIYCLLKTKEKN